jgi:TPR repeat protein
LHPDLQYARRRAYRSEDPFWWSNLAAAYATQRPPDLARAREWYRRAAKRRDLRGLFEYGLMLIQGEGGPSRPAEGRRLVQRAAALGELDALRVLSHAFAHGAFTFQRSARRAKQMQQALDRAVLAQREDLAEARTGRQVLPTNETRREGAFKRRKSGSG